MGKLALPRPERLLYLLIAKAAGTATAKAMTPHQRSPRSESFTKNVPLAFSELCHRIGENSIFI
jgi:hypothetical protein